MSADLIAGLALIAIGAALMLSALAIGERCSRRRRLRRVRGNCTAATPYSGPRYQRHGRRQ